MKRSKPLRCFGRRAARQADEWDQARLLVRTAALWTVAHQDRANIYVCTRCLKHVEHVDVHHLVSRARGGTHDVTNLCCLCRPCHSGVHDHSLPDWKLWIRSGRDARFHKEAQLEGTTGFEASSEDLDGGAA